MREIKFRAWNFEKEEMYYLPSYHKEYLIFSEAGCSPIWEMKFDSSFERVYVDNKNGYLMQYSGDADNEDKDIYESDIIGDKVVTWHSGGFCLISITAYQDKSYQKDVEWYLPYGLGNLGFNERKVCGNIFQNPELLEKSDEKPT